MSIPITLGTECGCGDISRPGASECEGCGRPFGCECLHCGDVFTLALGTQKFCSDRCRKREHRGAARPVPLEPSRPPQLQQWWRDRMSADELADLAGGWAA